MSRSKRLERHYRGPYLNRYHRGFQVSDFNSDHDIDTDGGKTDQTSKEPGFFTCAGGSVRPAGRHCGQGQRERRKSNVYRPAL